MMTTSGDELGQIAEEGVPVLDHLLRVNHEVRWTDLLACMMTSDLATTRKWLEIESGEIVKVGRETARPGDTAAGTTGSRTDLEVSVDGHLHTLIEVKVLAALGSEQIDKYDAVADQLATEPNAVRPNLRLISPRQFPSTPDGWSTDSLEDVLACFANSPIGWVSGTAAGMLRVLQVGLPSVESDTMWPDLNDDFSWDVQLRSRMAWIYQATPAPNDGYLGLDASTTAERGWSPTRSRWATTTPSTWRWRRACLDSLGPHRSPVLRIRWSDCRVLSSLSSSGAKDRPLRASTGTPSWACGPPRSPPGSRGRRDRPGPHRSGRSATLPDGLTLRLNSASPGTDHDRVAWNAALDSLRLNRRERPVHLGVGFGENQARKADWCGFGVRINVTVPPAQLSLGAATALLSDICPLAEKMANAYRPGRSTP